MKKYLSLTFFIAFTLVLPHFAHADITSNLQGWWKYDEGAGSSVTDYSGNANTGTTVNSPTYVVGKIGSYAMNFVSASDQYVNVGNGSSLQITGDLTLSTWVKFSSIPASGHAYQIMAKDKDTGGRAYTFDYYNADGTDPNKVLRFYINGGATMQDLVQNAWIPTLGTWYHIVATYSTSGTLTLYVDGSQVAQSTGAETSIVNASGDLLLGRRGYAGFTEPFDGSLDDSRVYNRTLNSTDVSELYVYNYTAGITSGLTAWYKFDEGSGTTVADSSGTGYTGTFSHSPSWITGKVGSFAITTDVNVTGDADSRVTVPSIPLGATWTTAWWTNFPLSSNGSYRTMFRSFSSSQNDHQVLVDPSGELGMYDNDGLTGFHGTGYNVSSISAGWHYMTVIGSGTTEKFYVDTVLVGTTDLKSDDVIDSIGNYTQDQTWGSIDDLRVYSRALSSTEIRQLYVGRLTPLSKFIINTGHTIKISLGRVFTVKSSFSPTNIPGLKLWLIGDNAPSGSIADWPDSSGSGNDAVQASGSAQPTKISSALNGHASVYFNGDDHLDSSYEISGAATAVFVAKIRSTPGSYGGIDSVMYGDTTTSGLGVFLDNVFGSGSQTYYAADSGTTESYNGATPPASPPGNWSQTNYAVGSVDGGSLSAATLTEIGHSPIGYGSNIEIVELVVYNSVLSTTNRQKVEDYLGKKYGITVTH